MLGVGVFLGILLSLPCCIQMAFCHVVMQGLPSLTSQVLSSSSVPLHVQTLFKILLGLKRLVTNYDYDDTKLVIMHAVYMHCTYPDHATGRQ